ncbi:antirestriction protein ArdA [Oleiagrimonas sp. C23AA]|uniref:antirestriction protein ArdA n=1 Tax=Oleiagrimonas sp. C23AA TaxID=2719047 RepID=UPI0014232296|nr:antirestriction protein ArdA [Oleiagrimonas sp. C23AA]
MTNQPNTSPRIYVACLAAYNNGYLHGTWIDAHQDAGGIRDEIAAMLARSPIKDAKEYAIRDYEGVRRSPILSSTEV